MIGGVFLVVAVCQALRSFSRSSPRSGAPLHFAAFRATIRPFNFSRVCGVGRQCGLPRAGIRFRWVINDLPLSSKSVIAANPLWTPQSWPRTQVWAGSCGPPISGPEFLERFQCPARTREGGHPIRQGPARGHPPLSNGSPQCHGRRRRGPAALAGESPAPPAIPSSCRQSPAAALACRPALTP